MKIGDKVKPTSECRSLYGDPETLTIKDIDKDGNILTTMYSNIWFKPNELRLIKPNYKEKIDIEELYKYIVQNCQTESIFLTPVPETKIEVVGLLDKIAELRGVDKMDNGLFYNEIAEKIR